MKTKLFLIFSFISTSIFGQKYFTEVEKWDVDDYYINVLAVYDELAMPKFLHDKNNNIAMLDIHYNILIARVNDAIIHYNILTGKTDTLFFVFHDTEISYPHWSPQNDKVAFLIYNENKTHNYTTQYRFIIITLDNGNVLKKEKFNVQNVTITYTDKLLNSSDELYTPYYDFELKENKILYKENENSDYIVKDISKIKGKEEIIKDFTYILSEKNKLLKVKILYKNLYGYTHKLLDDRYLCSPDTVIDLKTRDFINLNIPTKYTTEPFWCDISPNKTKLVVFTPTQVFQKFDETANVMAFYAAGHITIISIPDLKIINKKFIPRADVIPADQYSITFNFLDDNTLSFDFYDIKKHDIVKVNLSLK